MTTSRMDASAESQEVSEVLHIHNYSLHAIKTITSEIKKFPIIYKDHKHICFAPQLIELAWTRIVSAVLDFDGNFSATQTGYWSLSFRELWKWMRLMLVRDMKQRAVNPFSIRKPSFYWLDSLKFVEKHISLDGEAGEVQLWNPYIQVKMLSADTGIPETGKCTVIWLMDTRDESNNHSECISIRFQSKGNVCNLAIAKTQTRSFPLSTISSDSDHLKVDESPIPEPSPGFFTNIPLATTQSPISSSQELTVQIPSEEPQEQSVEVDEDFQFTMSLLPKLKELEPKMNIDVKMQILQALHDSF